MVNLRKVLTTIYPALSIAPLQKTFHGSMHSDFKHDTPDVPFALFPDGVYLMSKGSTVYDSSGGPLGIATSNYVEDTDNTCRATFSITGDVSLCHLDYYYDKDGGGNLDVCNGGYAEIDGSYRYAYFVTNEYPYYPQYLRGEPAYLPHALRKSQPDPDDTTFSISSDNEYLTITYKNIEGGDSTIEVPSNPDFDTFENRVNLATYIENSNFFIENYNHLLNNSGIDTLEVIASGNGDNYDIEMTDMRSNTHMTDENTMEIDSNGIPNYIPRMIGFDVTRGWNDIGLESNSNGQRWIKNLKLTEVNDASPNNAVGEQDHTIAFPLIPQYADELTETELGTVGIALNGIPIFNPFDSMTTQEITDNAQHPESDYFRVVVVTHRSHRAFITTTNTQHV